MTHYMELLQANQPWNLIFFMAIPVILAETLAISEFFILLNKRTDGPLRLANRIAGLIAGPYFAIVFLYLLITAVIPLTTTGQWRGGFDVIAVGFYLFGVVPYVLISLMEFNVVGKNLPLDRKLRLHAIFVSIFLVVAHIAMIFGMLDPALISSVATSGMAM
ncbi:MAG: permease [Actinobacteria bacterium]|nr:permease [Actinomycetota bacterium]